MDSYKVTRLEYLFSGIHVKHNFIILSSTFGFDLTGFLIRRSVVLNLKDGRFDVRFNQVIILGNTMSRDISLCSVFDMKYLKNNPFNIKKII